MKAAKGFNSFIIEPYPWILKEEDFGHLFIVRMVSTPSGRGLLYDPSYDFTQQNGMRKRT